jgi:hypothetical protein
MNDSWDFGDFVAAAIVLIGAAINLTVFAGILYGGYLLLRVILG